MPQMNVDHVWYDVKKTVAERVDALVGAMTLREKIAQMLHQAPPIPRLGVPAYNWWNECLHGVGRAGRATVFPQSIGMAATFNVPLTKRVATTISDEARVKHHQALKRENRGIYFGLTYWTPNINIFRDPRWGRGQETYGECPYLTARMGVAFVKGMQGNDPNYLKLVATPKHYAVHSGPEPMRHHFNAEVSQRDLRETYLPAFEATVREGKAWSVMGAYNRTNSEPCCGSKTLLQEILRDEWGFKGYVVSDCWAIKDFHLHHKVVETAEESAAMAVKNGCDLNCGDMYPNLLGAVKQGLISEDEIDVSVKRLFEARFRLGMFDPQGKVPWSKLKPGIVNCDSHQKLALKAARESIVLLKNDNHTLPLSKALKTIAVVGPNAARHDVLWGNYNGFSSHFSTLLEGIVGKASIGTQVYYGNNGGFTAQCGDPGEIEAIIACMGVTPEMEGEETGGEAVPDAEGGGDRVRIGLPERQQKLLEEVVATGKPVILVLTGGSPIELSWAKKHCAAILMVWYPGEAGGEAVADVIFGDYNPAGRLPLTFIKSLDDIPDFTDYRMKGRTYRFMRKKPLYPFGYGLSYTTFAYSKLKIDGLKVTVDVKNSGELNGDEVVQVYLTNSPAKVPTPIKQLIAFKRVHVKAGQTKNVTFTIKRKDLAAYDSKGNPFVASGDYTISVGGGQPDDVTSGAVMGTAVVAEK
jgi:beta-glucosidase